ncbi:hypothetical protein F3G54_32070 [Pseudomonas aeruginosa]|nr:hypothetical protein F3G54_32070 [Pseudomonas aeruginosa]
MSDSESDEEEGAGDPQAGVLEGAGLTVATEATDNRSGAEDGAGAMEAADERVDATCAADERRAGTETAAIDAGALLASIGDTGAAGATETASEFAA